MIRRNRWSWYVSLGVLATGLVLLAAACGGGGKSAATTTTSTVGNSQQKTFPNFRIVYDTGTDYLDPALSYTVQGWGAMWNVYLSLLGYKHVNGPDGATLVPALAKALPTISADGLTYTMTLRDGLKYSDGTPVKASDFKYAIKRDFLADSPGVGFFTNIEGADEFSKTKKGDITGITADDATGKITVKLVKPQGDFQNILATIFAAPVPADTPAKDQSTTPIPSTGPYQIQSYTPNRQFVLVRNPNFEPTDNVPATNPDKMTFKIVEDDSAALQQVINGQADYDFHPIPVDRLADVQQKYGDQLKIYTPANTYYYFMNNRLPPFDKLAVRKAVNYAIDRNALVRLYGGLATPTENILPPTYPQYQKHTLYPHNLAKAKQLIKAVGVRADRRGVGISTARRRGSRSSTGGGPEPDRLQVEAEDHRRRRLLDDGRQPGDEGADRLRGLVPGLPASARLVRRAAERQPDHEDAQQQLLERRPPRSTTKIEALKKQPKRPPRSTRVGGSRQDGRRERALGAVREPQFTDFFSSNSGHGCYVNQVLYQFDWSRICMK